MTRVANDKQSISAYLDRSALIPRRAALLAAVRYKQAWAKRGYSLDHAAKAVEWYWQHHRPTDKQARPKTVDEALGQAVRDAAAARYKYGVITNMPCYRCQYLERIDNDLGGDCNRLMIWVAVANRSTCPEFSEVPS